MTRPTLRSNHATQTGVSLIETVIGLGLLATLAVSVAGLLATASRHSADTRHETMMLWLARERLEQLQALALAINRLPSGVTIVLTDSVTDLSHDPPTVAGTGLMASPPDALERSCPGFEDHLDWRGRWVGADDGALSRAAYTRRWSIRAERRAGLDILVFDVIVSTRARMERGAVAFPVGPGMVHLSGAIARRAA